MKKSTPSIACRTCKNWVHLKCADLNYKQAKAKFKDFQCSKCVVDTAESDHVDVDMDTAGKIFLGTDIYHLVL